MTDFDPRWKDFPDYILEITHRIWEGRDVASLRESYAPELPVRTPAGVLIGNEATIAATLATLHQFPDRTLLADDVVWSVDDTGHFHSSHRLMTTATHLGDGVFGPPTGRRLMFRAIADCAARAGVIDDEWLLRDSGAIVRALGRDPFDFAREQIEREGGPERAHRPFTPADDVPGPYRGRGNDDGWGLAYEATLGRLMVGDFAAVRRDYDRAVVLEAPGGLTHYGHEGVDRCWLGLRSSLPSARFEVHHRVGREDPLMRPRAAIRWSLTGAHDGWGLLGAPSGAEVHVFGVSHAEYGPFGLRREYVLWDEVAVAKQICLATG